MDLQLNEVSQHFNQFKATNVRKDYDSYTNLLFHLKNRIAEFHAKSELLSPTALENPCIKHAVEFEQSFMEGLQPCLSARDEIAGCDERAYDSLSINNAWQMLLFPSDGEILEYIKAKHPEWEVKNAIVFFQKAKDSTTCKEIPPLQLINQKLSYVRELERIV